MKTSVFSSQKLSLNAAMSITSWIVCLVPIIKLKILLMHYYLARAGNSLEPDLGGRLYLALSKVCPQFVCICATCLS